MGLSCLPLILVFARITDLENDQDAENELGLSLHGIIIHDLKPRNVKIVIPISRLVVDAVTYAEFCASGVGLL